MGRTITGQLTHRLMQARELTERQSGLADAQGYIDAAIRAVREVHHRHHGQQIE